LPNWYYKGTAVISWSTLQEPSSQQLAQLTRPASQLICPAKYASTAIHWQSATGMEAFRGATWTSTSSSEEVTIRAGSPRPGKPPSRPAGQPGCPDSQHTQAKGQKAQFPDWEAPFPGQIVCIAGRMAQEPDRNLAAEGPPARFQGRTTCFPGPFASFIEVGTASANSASR
jgi:hypothetical protein